MGDRSRSRISREADYKPTSSRSQHSATNDKGITHHTTVYDTATDAEQPVSQSITPGGQPLDSETRSFMEPRFNHDFSSVRVHTDTQAAESARSVNALAYTVGQDIVFGAGQYATETQAGKRLLAHELTHTIQQPSIATTNANTLSMSHTYDASEQAAHKVADKVVSNRPTSIHSGDLAQTSALMIQRQEDTGSTASTQLKPPTLTKEHVIESFTIDQFRLGSTSLTRDHQAKLNALIEKPLTQLDTYPDTYISIVGHTDTTGTDARNEVVGQGRAEQVMEFLASKRVPMHLMHASNKGASEPAVKTEKGVEEAHNRRVEISIKQQSKEQPAQALSIFKPKPIDLNIHPKHEYDEETPGERYHRIDEALKNLEKQPKKPGMSVNDVLNQAVDSLVNPLMESLKIPKEYRSKIRDAAHDAVQKGIESLIDTAMDQSNLDSTQKKAIHETIKGVLQYKQGKGPGQ